MPVSSAQHELVFGTCPLVPADPSGLAYEINTLAELDFGNPEPVVAPIQSLLLDGQLAEVLSYDNRNIVIRVQISAATLADVSAGERDLMAEVGGRNTLTWRPPDEFSEPTVFDVIWSRFDYTFDDLEEAQRQTRTFVITLNCAPFGRDEDETVVEAVGAGETPPTPATATMDACTATTGWALTSSPSTPSSSVTIIAPFISDGGVRAGFAVGSTGFQTAQPPVWSKLTRTGLSADMSTTPYLTITARVFYAGYASTGVEYRINGVVVQPFAHSGGVRYFDASAFGTVTSVEVMAQHQSRRGAGRVEVSVDDISRTNVPPFVGTRRMQNRLLTVGGSARTEASLSLTHETLALGEVRIYTSAANESSGYQPPLRQYRNNSFGGSATPDSSSVSGGRSMLNAATPETYDVPASALIAGTHLLEAIIKGTTGPKAINYSATTLVGSTEYGTVTGIGLVTLVTTGWEIVPIASLALPPVALPPGSTAKIRIHIWSASAVEIDEAFIFNTDIGRLTGVICGTGTPATGGPASRVWVDTPTLDWPNPSIWLGTTEDRSDARHAIGGDLTTGGEVPSQGTHLFEPGEVNLFTLSTGATDVAASLRYHRRHQHNRAD